MGFEQAPIPKDSIDVAISNVPFGNYQVFDPSFKKDKKKFTHAIHNYYFVKTMEELRPGGVLAFINWCPSCETAISDLEVEHEEQHGHLWHFRYPFADGSGSVVVATTRPETMLGDTAVAVNPDDARYAGVIGKTIRLPLMERDIPLIADSYRRSRLRHRRGEGHAGARPE